MIIYPMRPLGRKHHRLAENPQDLFAWAEAQATLDPPPQPRAARIIARRFALPPSIARHVAELAGFAMEGANG